MISAAQQGILASDLPRRRVPRPSQCYHREPATHLGGAALSRLSGMTAKSVPADETACFSKMLLSRVVNALFRQGPKAEQCFFVRPFRFILSDSTCQEVWCSVSISILALPHLGQMSKISLWLSGQAHISAMQITSFHQMISWLKLAGRNYSFPLWVLFFFFFSILNSLWKTFRVAPEISFWKLRKSDFLSYNKVICLSYTGSSWHRKALREI